MELKSIFMLVMIIVLLVVVIKYAMKDANTLTNVTDGKTTQTIEASKLASSSSSNSASNFSYSIWFYIDDWNYRYGEPKVIFGRMTAGNTEPCPSVSLGAIQNNLLVALAVYSGTSTSGSTGTASSHTIHTCNVSNVPIQKWTNLIVSAYGRSLDVYIDGKLVKTCVLPGVAYIDSSAPVYVTPNGGFAGWTSKFAYFSEACDPQKAWNIYQEGFGGSLLGNTFGSYSVKVSVMNGETEQSSYTI
jgi:hypothetical protein